MAHFAQIDANNVVVRVVVINNDAITDESGQEIEALGRQFCSNIFGGNWIQTSYNSNMRMHYAAEGAIYYPEYDAFSKGSKPFPSWVLNTETMEWNAPKPKPTDAIYDWDEEKLDWVVDENARVKST